MKIFKSTSSNKAEFP